MLTIKDPTDDAMVRLNVHNLALGKFIGDNAPAEVSVEMIDGVYAYRQGCFQSLMRKVSKILGWTVGWSRVHHDGTVIDGLFLYWVVTPENVKACYHGHVKDHLLGTLYEQKKGIEFHIDEAGQHLVVFEAAAEVLGL